MIRLMTAADIGAGMRLKEAARWNQTTQDWENVLALEPEGCWVYEVDGVVVGSTTAVLYGQDMAWIGMVLVLPEYRGRGIARELMQHALRYLEERAVHCVKLDATDMGRPLYEQLGFVEELVIERWAGTAEARKSVGKDATPGFLPMMLRPSRRWIALRSAQTERRCWSVWHKPFQGTRSVCPGATSWADRVLGNIFWDLALRAVRSKRRGSWRTS